MFESVLLCRSRVARGGCVWTWMLVLYLGFFRYQVTGCRRWMLVVVGNVSLIHGRVQTFVSFYISFNFIGFNGCMYLQVLFSTHGCMYPRVLFCTHGCMYPINLIHGNVKYVSIYKLCLSLLFVQFLFHSSIYKMLFDSSHKTMITPHQLGFFSTITTLSYTFIHFSTITTILLTITTLSYNHYLLHTSFDSCQHYDHFSLSSTNPQRLVQNLSSLFFTYP